MRAATSPVAAGPRWKLAVCAGCQARRMMPHSNISCLFCVDGLERARPGRSRGNAAGRRPSVEIPALRLLREARGLTIAELACCAGADYTTVMRSENRVPGNRRRARSRTARKLAEALGVVAEEISGRRTRGAA